MLSLQPGKVSLCSSLLGSGSLSLLDGLSCKELLLHFLSLELLSSLFLLETLQLLRSLLCENFFLLSLLFGLGDLRFELFVLLDLELSLLLFSGKLLKECLLLLLLLLLE